MSVNNERREHEPTYNMVPGTVVRLRNRIFVLVDAAPLAMNSLRGDTNNLPVVLFDPLDTGTITDKENNDDND